MHNPSAWTWDSQFVTHIDSRNGIILYGNMTIHLFTLYVLLIQYFLWASEVWPGNGLVVSAYPPLYCHLGAVWLRSCVWGCHITRCASVTFHAFQAFLLKAMREAICIHIGQGGLAGLETLLGLDTGFFRNSSHRHTSCNMHRKPQGLRVSTLPTIPTQFFKRLLQGLPLAGGASCCTDNCKGMCTFNRKHLPRQK